MTNQKGQTPRCCANCYHYGSFLGYDGLTCEQSHKRKKRPYLYTSCKSFGYVDMVTGAKVVPCG